MTRARRYCCYKIIVFFVCIVGSIYAEESVLYGEGTTGICIIRNDTIWIGVDSKVTDTMGSDSLFKCKILTTDKIIFTQTGNNFYIDSQINIHIDTLFINCANEDAAPTQIINCFHDAVLAAYKIIGSNEMLSMRYSIGDTIPYRLNSIFAFNEESIPHLYLISYKIVVLDTSAGSKNPLKIIFQKNLRRANSEVPSYYLAGRIDAILDTMIHFIAPNLDKLDIPVLINHLIEIQATAQPNHVGGGISIISICPQGINWFQKNKPCK